MKNKNVKNIKTKSRIINVYKGQNKKVRKSRTKETERKSQK